MRKSAGASRGPSTDGRGALKAAPTTAFLFFFPSYPHPEIARRNVQFRRQVGRAEHARQQSDHCAPSTQATTATEKEDILSRRSDHGFVGVFLFPRHEFRAAYYSSSFRVRRGNFGATGDKKGSNLLRNTRPGVVCTKRRRCTQSGQERGGCQAAP